MPSTRTTSTRNPAPQAAAPHSPPPDAPASAPNLGLVCITAGEDVRYRTITRTRFLAFDEDRKRAALDELYRDNVQTLFKAVDYCHARGIRLYRVTSNLFPQVDHPVGRATLDSLRDAMGGFGAHAAKRDVRVVIHPDQWVVINSESPAVVTQSVAIMEDHARAFDLLGLPRSPWSLMLVHGGKGGRADALVETIAKLPDGVRSRLALENDESAFSAEQILDACRRAGVPMVFDAHHHAVRERLDSYEDPSVRAFTLAARETWRPHPEWQVVHISNSATSFLDPKHSDTIKRFPSAFADVPWVEVEAKQKEVAIGRLRGALSRPGGPRPPA